MQDVTTKNQNLKTQTSNHTCPCNKKWITNNSSISTNPTCYSSPSDPLCNLSSAGWILAGTRSVARRDHQAVSASCPALADEPAKELQAEIELSQDCEVLCSSVARET